MPGPCSFCEAECCKNYLIVVTSFDVYRIQQKTGIKAEEFAYFSNLDIINFNEELVLEFLQPGNRFIEEGLLAIKSRPCYFLERDKCKIYKFAPLACKKYPYSSKGLMSGKVCPAIPRMMFRMKIWSRFPKNYLDELYAYAHIVGEWNRAKKPREECLEFLLDRTKEIIKKKA